MKAIPLCFVFATAAAAVCAQVRSGSSKEEVIAAYGAPKSATQFGTKEVLNYPERSVVLENDRVVRIEVKVAAIMPAAGQAAPAAVAAGVRPAKRAQVAPKYGEWFQDFEAAKLEAGAKGRRILALFTGSDWCPPCKRFEADVAHDADFLKAVEDGSLVLLRLDFPHHSQQSPEVKRQNQDLADRYGIKGYPTLLMISADGERSLVVGARQPWKAKTSVELYCYAVVDTLKAFDETKW